MHQVKPLSYTQDLIGISEKTNIIHHDKLYAGYVAKRNEIEQKLASVDLTSANATYSDLRALKVEETFAANGMVLHEVFFDTLGQPNADAPRLKERLNKDFGDWEKWAEYFKMCGLVARGWVVLAWDTNIQKLVVYIGDAHNQGGVWGCVPIITLDVYEHAYFIDFGSDRKSYIEAWWQNINWAAAERRFMAAVGDDATKG